MNQQQALWMVKGAIETLTQEEKAEIDSLAQGIRDIVGKDPAGAGLMALTLVYIEKMNEHG